MEGGLQLRFPKLERSHENEKMTIIIQTNDILHSEKYVY